MSSAILYVAIVAIWAGVLIPRWLRRDSAASERADENLVTADAEPEEQPAPRSRRRGETAPAAHVVPSVPAVPSAPPAPRPAVRPEPERIAGRHDGLRDGLGDGLRDEEHKKVLTARRRLLGMLMVLAAGSGALAYTGMAAWWVIVPPAMMVIGYLVLLREASKADAERRGQARVQATAAAAVAAARRAAPPAPARSAPARSAPAASAAFAGSAGSATRGGRGAPDAEVIDISASLTVAGQEFYDQHADAKLRAVGDLARLLTG